jgi:hypothetical protein
MRILVCFCLSLLIISQGCTKITTPDNGIFGDFNEAAKVRKLLEKNDERFMPAYKKLISDAGRAMNEGPFSVMQKKRTAASGDMHDYLSMGTYWWPDTTRPDGLPYIRRDGNVNPETEGEYVDAEKKNSMMSNVETLAWAYFFSGEEKYAAKAVQLIKTWFTDSATMMNPNLNYAQAIPGVCDGRGIGIIDLHRINKLIAPLQILQANDKIDAVTREKLNEWFDEYLDWLLTSPNGIDEEDEKNNHGTWYDVQVCGIALYLGKNDIAKARLENATLKRIDSQIEADGSQPKELARTRSLSYSSMNLRAFLNLSIIGKLAGVDILNYTTPDGKSIMKAADYLLPYANGSGKWNGDQITSMDEAIESLKPDFRIVYALTRDKKYDLPGQGDDLETLLFPGI